MHYFFIIISTLPMMLVLGLVFFVRMNKELPQKSFSLISQKSFSLAEIFFSLMSRVVLITC
jgi:hypothetical protein